MGVRGGVLESVREGVDRGGERECVEGVLKGVLIRSMRSCVEKV